MNWLDLCFIGILLVSVLVGIWRGLLYELLAIAGWLVAYWGAGYLAPALQGWLPEQRLGPGLAHALALVLAFMLILLLWGLAAKLLRALLHATPLSIFDRAAGAAFGALRGLLLALLAVVLVSMTPLSRAEVWTAARTVPLLQAVLHGIEPMLPEAVVKFIPA
ncbi:CvpA family protein [Roseateles aquae]|nr:CvpA family protein [Paucibacter sp. APW11]